VTFGYLNGSTAAAQRSRPLQLNRAQRGARAPAALWQGARWDPSSRQPHRQQPRSPGHRDVQSKPIVASQLRVVRATIAAGRAGRSSACLRVGDRRLHAGRSSAAVLPHAGCALQASCRRSERCRPAAARPLCDVPQASTAILLWTEHSEWVLMPLLMSLLGAAFRPRERCARAGASWSPNP
jgi:hypothetical protein